MKNKKVIGAFLKAVGRGLVRSLPFGIGNILVEANDVVTGNKMPSKDLLSDPTLTETEIFAIDKFKRYAQLGIQILVAVCIIYSFMKGNIPLSDLMKLVQTSK